VCGFAKTVSTHRTDTIERAAEFWECNKTTVSMRSADFACRIDSGIRAVLGGDDLTTEQKREIAETLTIPCTYGNIDRETVTVGRGEDR
jgi:hypothetical protein